MATILPPPNVLPNPLASPIYGQPILTPSQKMEIQKMSTEIQKSHDEIERLKKEIAEMKHKNE